MAAAGPRGTHVGTMARLVSVALVFLATTAACGVSPLGRRQLLLMSDDVVDKQGIAAYAQYKSKVPTTKKARDQRYVACITNAVVAEVTEGDIPESWEVNTFQDDTPNAFAIPGGKIGVHSGLLDVSENQDQVAAVLGHEVAHVLARHSNERLSAQQATGLVLATAQASGYVDPQLMNVFGMGAQYGVILPYSRTHESEADLLGLDLMARAGFDPRQAVVFWDNMDEAAATSGGQAPPEILSTHPGSATRRRDLNDRMPHAMQLYEQARAQGKKPRCSR